MNTHSSGRFRIYKTFRIKFTDLDLIEKQLSMHNELCPACYTLLCQRRDRCYLRFMVFVEVDSPISSFSLFV